MSDFTEGNRAMSDLVERLGRWVEAQSKPPTVEELASVLMKSDSDTAIVTLGDGSVDATGHVDDVRELLRKNAEMKGDLETAMWRHPDGELTAIPPRIWAKAVSTATTGAGESE